MLLMVVAPRAVPAAHPSLWRGFKEGVVYAWNMAPVRLLLPVVALVSFMATPYQALMPIFAAEVFAGGADTLGLLMGAAGVGGVGGIVLLASRRELRGLLTWIVAACFCGGAGLAVFAYSTHFALSVAMLAIAGAGIVLTVNGISTITVTIVDDKLRGRVAGFYTMAFLGMYPVGGLAAGALASSIGAPHTLALGGACCMLCALWLARRLPGLRREMRPIYERLGLMREQKA
jgi:MFS family permease